MSAKKLSAGGFHNEHKPQAIANNHTMSTKLHSFGFCCEMLGVDCDQLRSLAQSAHVTPALQLDSVSYFDAAAIEQIRQHLAASSTE